MRVPFNRPKVLGKELYYVANAIERGHLSADGYYTGRCQALLEERYSVPRCLLTTSCTHAMELASLLLGLGPEDEFIVPSFTFVTTVSAFHMQGARPIFVDVRPDTLNVDENQVESLISARTRLLVLVHYAGVSCEMDALMSLAKKRGIEVFEDAAQGIESRWKGRPLGTMGSLGALSFHETKNVSCGEGGALLVNEASYIERAEILRQKGTDRSRFLRGMTDKYTWVAQGSSYAPSDLLAAYLLGQLEQIEQAQSQRRAAWFRYYDVLRPLEEKGLLRLPVIPKGAESNHHLFHVLTDSENSRQRLIAHLKGLEIQAVFHYVPLHLSPMGAALGWLPGSLPVTEDAASRLLRLPLYAGITPLEQDRVIEGILGFYGEV
jgi:dTDP-4-amino-4,6-dideoxygalactose transaminase